MNMHERESNELNVNRAQSRRKDKFVINRFSNSKGRNDSSAIRKIITRRNLKKNFEQTSVISNNANISTVNWINVQYSILIKI